MIKQIIFADKIKVIRKTKNLTMQELADKIGVSKGTISLWESGKNTPPQTTISLIDKLFSEEISPIDQPKDFVLIPQVKGEIGAGNRLIPDDVIEIRVTFRRDWIQQKGDPRNMSFIKVRGDSMEPTLMSGDLILVDHGRNYIDPQGGLYAIAIDGKIAVKRIQIILPSKTFRIISDNKKYDVMEVDEGQIIINGKVIWFGRDLER